MPWAAAGQGVAFTRPESCQPSESQHSPLPKKQQAGSHTVALPPKGQPGHAELQHRESRGQHRRPAWPPSPAGSVTWQQPQTWQRSTRRWCQESVSPRGQEDRTAAHSLALDQFHSVVPRDRSQALSGATVLKG